MFRVRLAFLLCIVALLMVSSGCGESTSTGVGSDASKDVRSVLNALGDDLQILERVAVVNGVERTDFVVSETIVSQIDAQNKFELAYRFERILAADSWRQARKSRGSERFRMTSPDGSQIVSFVPGRVDSDFLAWDEARKLVNQSLDGVVPSADLLLVKLENR